MAFEDAGRDLQRDSGRLAGGAGVARILRLSGYADVSRKQSLVRMGMHGKVYKWGLAIR
jgi:hypothetical protein